MVQRYKEYLEYAIAARTLIFNLLAGQCEGLYTVERVTDWLHVLICMAQEKSLILTANDGVSWHRIVNSMKVVHLLLAFSLTMFATSSFAQLTKEQIKERKENYHISTIPLDTNELKVARNIYSLNKV